MSSEDVRIRIDALCRGDLPAKALREQVLAQVRRVVPFDGHVFGLTDPVTRVATSPLADVPLPWDRLPEVIRWRYQSPQLRWDRPEGSSPTATLLGSGPTPLFEHVLRDLGVVDTAVTAYADRYGCWGMLDVWRLTAPFAPAEAEFLASLAPTVATGLRRAVARTFVEPEPLAGPVGPAVVVLSGALTVQAQTEAAAAALLRLNPPDEPMPPIPAAAYNVGGALLAAEAGLPIGEPWARVHLGGNRWVTVRAARIGDDIAVSIEQSTSAERMDLVARAHGLSARESEVLTLLADGRDSKDIAAALVVSEHTANDHVKAILAKTGWRTRQLLLARALGSA